MATQKGSPLASEKKVNKLLTDDIKTGFPETVSKVRRFSPFGHRVRKSYKILNPGPLLGIGFARKQVGTLNVPPKIKAKFDKQTLTQNLTSNN